MSDTSVKKAFGVYSTIVAAILSLAAGIYFQMINGTFGATKRVCYDAPVVYLLIGGAVVTVLLIALKRYGLASAVVTRFSFSSISATGTSATFLLPSTKRALTRSSLFLSVWLWRLS